MAVGVRAKLAELMHYGGVGVLAAAIHALVLLGGEWLGGAQKPEEGGEGGRAAGRHCPRSDRSPGSVGV